ncbi:hypothetical protein ANCCAN_09976 [Ancylostoma caninum]|uniref:SCP domain-containing protein n=1 Tax=Ancylostoma caninum TaxID=29170 RepID=A0A368GI17_ANCCA|nr:hypothetical protein ANCCAN_09976 [Ancylostoma caninum]
MTDELRDTALYMHNYYRRLLASGWAKDGQIEYARPAVSMPALVIEEWWKPLETTGIKDNLYKDSMKDTDLQNYVNMAYQGTKAVGCGVQQCEKSGKMLVQCAYATDSPIDDGDPIYTTGKTCSKCNKLAATPKCSPLGGLCVP